MGNSDPQADAAEQANSRAISWLLPLALSLALVWLSQYGFLLFHTVAELFAIIVAIIMSVVAWHTFRFSENNYLMYLGCGYLSVALLDLLHTFSYPGIGILESASMNSMASIWIAGRYLEAVLLLSAPLFLHRTLNRGAALAGYMLVATALYLTILFGYFPLCYDNETGLTPFKIGSEYAIMLLLAGAMLFLWFKRTWIQPSVRRQVMASIALTILAEFSFTQYVSILDSALSYGHILKFLSYWLIFTAIVQTSLKEPFQMLARGAHTYDAIPDPVLVVDHKGLIREVNPAALDKSGQAEHQLLGSHCHDWFHDSSLQRENCPVCKAILTGTALTDVVHRASSQRWLEISLSPIRTKVGLEGMVHAVRDVTETKLAQDQLAAYSDRLELQVRERTFALESINKELEGFNYSVSHDLRAPLRAIDGFSMMLADEYTDTLDQNGREYLRRVRKATQRMGGLIDDLLKLSRIGRGAIKRETVDVSAMCRNAVNLLQDADPRREVEVDIEPGMQAFADAGLLTIVLDNLLGNAWKYSRKSTPARIRISQQREAGRDTFCVGDNGAGFDMSQVDRLFGAFQRLHDAREYEGSGIGLATVQRIISRHGGRVWAESEMDRGSSFYFALPTEDSKATVLLPD